MKKAASILILLFLFLSSCSKDDNTVIPEKETTKEEESKIIKSSEKQLTSFVLDTINNTVITENITAAINEPDKIITATVPNGTDITALAPTIQFSEKAAISPIGIQDFSSPVTYTVIAEDGANSTYTANIAIAPNTGKNE